MKTADKASADTRQQRSKEKRSLIRKAAYRCFAAEGYHSATVDKMSATLNISKGSFYWYFSGKQAVFLDILDSWAQEVENEIAAQFATAFKGPKPFASVRKALETELFKRRRIIPVWLEFLAHTVRVDEVRAGLRDFHRRILGSVDNLLAPILPAAFGKQDRHALSVLFVAAYIGLLGLHLVDPVTFDTKDVAGRFMSILQLVAKRTDFVDARIEPAA